MLSKKCDLRLVDKMARGERDLSVKKEAIEDVISETTRSVEEKDSQMMC